MSRSRTDDGARAWRPEGAPRQAVPIDAVGWLRIAVRGGAILAVLALAFPLLLLLRLPERAIWRRTRPVTPWITQATCRVICALLGLRRSVVGAPMRHPGAHVANHTSWLDVLVLNASARVYFVAKSEVRGWSGIGWLARGTGTAFVTRARQAAKRDTDDLARRLAQGHRLLIFPEGTSSDGLRVLPFKSTIFAPILTPVSTGPESRYVQPVSLRYHAPRGREARFYGWWAGLSFGASLLEVLAQAPQGRVDVIWGTPIAVAGHDRKTLAAAAEAAVRKGYLSAEARSGP